jgi:GTP cyclohydrolase FolE2
MIAPKLKDIRLTTKQINEVLKIIMPATHTQRGTATLILDRESSKISHKDLYRILEKSTHLAYDLLKRADEHDLVIRAVQKPQFTEDVAREITDIAYHQFKNTLSADAEIFVESLINDAIHIHDVGTVIKKNFREIQKEIHP